METVAKKSEPAPPNPSHIIMLADCGALVAGKVVVFTDDVKATLDRAKATYRAATARERSLGGFMD